MHPLDVFLLHLSVTLFLCGLIWVVQVVHYPLFDRVNPKGWPAFAAAHRRLVRSNWIRTALWTLRAVGLVVAAARTWSVPG